MTDNPEGTRSFGYEDGFVNVNVATVRLAEVRKDTVGVVSSAPSPKPTWTYRGLLIRRRAIMFDGANPATQTKMRKKTSVTVCIFTPGALQR